MQRPKGMHADNFVHFALKTVTTLPCEICKHYVTPVVYNMLVLPHVHILNVKNTFWLDVYGKL